jgi:tetratricopeptide (TPR) repeat protein
VFTYATTMPLGPRETDVPTGGDVLSDPGLPGSAVEESSMLALKMPVRAAPASCTHGLPRRLLCLVVVLGLVGSGVAGAAPPRSAACEPFRLGQEALAQRRLPVAGAQFKRAVADSCQVAGAKRGLAELAWRLNRPAEAERLYREAIAWEVRHEAMESAANRVGLGLVLLRLSRIEDAGVEFRRALDIDPDGWDTAYGRVRLFMSRGEWDAVVPALDRVASRANTPQVQGEYNFAMALYHEGIGDLASAEGEAMRAASLDPTDPERLELVNRICLKRGTTNLAILAFEQARHDSGTVAPAPLLTELGRLYRAARRNNDARDAYVAAASADSSYAPALRDLADLMRLAKKPALSSQIYLRYLALVPRDVDAMLYLCEACLDNGQFEQAAKTARDAMLVAPSRPDVRRAFVRAGLRSANPVTRKPAAAAFLKMASDTTWTVDDWLALAEHQRESGDWEAARASTARAAVIDPASPQIEFELGMIEISAGKAPEAIAHLQASIERQPDAPKYHLNLGIALVAAGRSGEGLAAMRRAVAMSSQNTQGRLVLARTLAAADSVRAGDDQYRAILAYEATNGPALCGLGWSRVRGADCKEALRLFRAAVDADPLNAEGWAGLGSASICAGDLAAAAQALDRARQVDPENVNVKKGLELLARARETSAP